MNLRLLRRYKNKILAVGFAALGVICLFAYVLHCELISGGAYFRNNPINIWNILLYSFVFISLLVYNLRNDNRAYSSILMFVFYVTFDSLIDVFFAPFNLPYLISNASSIGAEGILLIVQFLITVGIGALGILLYLRCRKYMYLRLNDFSKIRLIGILFALAVAASVACSIASFAVNDVYSLSDILWVSILSIGEIFVAVSCCFTLERLRRL